MSEVMKKKSNAKGFNEIKKDINSENSSRISIYPTGSSYYQYLRDIKSGDDNDISDYSSIFMTF